MEGDPLRYARLLVTIVAGCALVTATACDGDTPESANAPTTAASSTAVVQADFPLTIDESDGEKLTLSAVPQRIVSLSAHATDIMCAIGAGSQLVAVEKYANCEDGGGAKPELDSFEPNVEAIVAFRPDLVYVSADTSSVVEALRSAGMPVMYVTLPVSLEQVIEQIDLFGRVTGNPDKAKSVADSLQKRIDDVESALADTTAGPRVYHELDTTFFSAGPASFVGDFYKVLKAQNIAAGATDEYPQLSSEAIVQSDPEVMVLADEEAGVTADSVSARPGWGAISAVKNHRICTIDASLVSQPGTKIADALETLAKCLYPDRFP